MTTFIIDRENSITALTQPEVAAGLPDGAIPFTSDRQLAQAAADWPTERLVEAWNGITGVKPVTRFTSRRAGVSRIWKAIQRLAVKTEQTPEPAQKKRGKTAKPAKKQKAAKAGKKRTAREGSKQAQVLDMLRRKCGCTLPEIMKATGWQAHTVRGFISGTVGKAGHRSQIDQE